MQDTARRVDHKKRSREASNANETDGNIKMKPYVVHMIIIRTSLQIFAINQGFNTLLHNPGVGVEEGQLVQDLRQQLLMLKGLTSLHNAHNSCFDGDGAVLLDTFCIEGRIQRCHGDANLAHVWRKLSVGGELVSRINFVACRRFWDDFVLSARQRVQQRLQNRFLEVQSLCQFFKCQRFTSIHGDQCNGLKRWHLPIVRLPPKHHANGSFPFRKHPSQLALLMLLAMPFFEDIHALGHLGCQTDLEDLYVGQNPVVRTCTWKSTLVSTFRIRCSNSVRCSLPTARSANIPSI